MDQSTTNIWRRRAVALVASLVAGALPVSLSSSAHAAGTDSPVQVSAVKTRALKEYRSAWLPAFTLKGESIAPIVVALAITSAPPGTSLTVRSPGKAQLNYGYISFEKVESVVFTANMATARDALKSVHLNAAGPGKVTLSVSVTVDETGYFYDPVRSRYYQYVANRGIKWTEALAAAATATFRGVAGHLATPTDQAQNDFLSSNIEGATNVWIGATDKDNEGEFKWATGDKAGTTFWKARCAANPPGSADSCSGANNVLNAGGQADGRYNSGVTDNPLVNTFASWDTSEPNNWGGKTTPENFVATNWNGTSGMWNDLPDSTPSIGGYVVEFPSTGGKPFVGVSRITRTYKVKAEKSPYKPTNVKAIEVGPGIYNVTWEPPKILKDRFRGKFAKKIIEGYRITNDVSGFAFFHWPSSTGARVWGITSGVMPVINVETITSVTPSNRKKGQKTFGAGVVAPASTAKDYVEFSSNGLKPIPPNAKISVQARGLANAASWTLTNIVDSAVLAQGVFTSGAVTASVPMPLLADGDGLQQINVRFTITNTDGSTDATDFSLLVEGRMQRTVFEPRSTIERWKCTMLEDRSYKCEPIVIPSIPNWIPN